MTDTKIRSGPPLALVLTAFVIVYLVWGSTYLAILFAIETMPPFLMAGVRYILAGTILYAITRYFSPVRPTLANWKAAATVGTLMLVGGNGLVCWSEQFVPSGLAALMIATVPLWLVVFDWLIYHGPRPTARIVVGLCAGLFGVATLLGPSSIGGESINIFGGLALMAACVFWAFGSLHSRRARLPRSLFLATAMQMTAGGVALVLLGTITGEWPRVDLSAVSTKSLLALSYLVVFGSILALSAYTWLLRVTTSARVGTYAYVNPVVAMMLGYAVMDEPITPRVLIAAAVILGSVILITTSRDPRKQDASETRAKTTVDDTPCVRALPSTTVAVQAVQESRSPVGLAGCAAPGRSE